MPKVTVYRYHHWENQKSEMVMVTAHRMGSLAGIQQVLGTPIDGTGVKIDDALLGPDEWELSTIGFQP
jgi:hypothetical protein